VQGAVVTIRRRDESGAVLMIMVISLVVLLGMAALVVDLGGSYSQRRKMQSGADAAAIGAAHDRTVASTSGAAGQATTIGNENLPKLTPNWNGCAGDVLPTSFVAYAGSNCISFSADRLPSWPNGAARSPLRPSFGRA